MLQQNGGQPTEANVEMQVRAPEKSTEVHENQKAAENNMKEPGLSNLVEQEPRPGKGEEPPPQPLTHSRSESHVITPLDEDGVTPKGAPTQLIEPKSAATKLVQDRHDMEIKGEEAQTNKESQKLSFSSKIGQQHLPLHITLGNPDAPAVVHDKSPGRTTNHVHGHLPATAYLASTHGAPSYQTIAF